MYACNSREEGTERTPTGVGWDVSKSRDASNSRDTCYSMEANNNKDAKISREADNTMDEMYNLGFTCSRDASNRRVTNHSRKTNSSKHTATAGLTAAAETRNVTDTDSSRDARRDT
jgi:hypothetical protein